MSQVRQQRTAEQIQRILGELFRRQLNDPRLQDVTVTQVRIDRELQHANVYVSGLGDESRKSEVMGALKRASGFLRRELSHRLSLRTVPLLHFHWDPTLAHAEQVHKLLDSLDIPPDDDDSDAEREPGEN